MSLEQSPPVSFLGQVPVPEGELGTQRGRGGGCAGLPVAPSFSARHPSAPPSLPQHSFSPSSAKRQEGHRWLLYFVRCRQSVGGVDFQPTSPVFCPMPHPRLTPVPLAPELAEGRELLLGSIGTPMCLRLLFPSSIPLEW